jgi:hypothetical protein
MAASWTLDLIGNSYWTQPNDSRAEASDSSLGVNSLMKSNAVIPTAKTEASVPYCRA